MKMLKAVFFSIAIILPNQAAMAERISPREELVIMVKQLQQNRFDAALRVKIIKLAHRLRPAPAIPPEAHKQFVIGSTLVKRGTTLRDAFQAWEAFQTASDLAPWWTDAYWNASVAADMAGIFSNEEWDLKFYLVVNPRGKKAVQNKLDQIDADKIMAKSGSPADSIAGFWEKKGPDENFGEVFQIQNSGSAYIVNYMPGGFSNTVTFANTVSINFISQILPSFPGESVTESPVDYACKVNGNRLVCDENDQSANSHGQETFIHRAHCEIVSDQKGIQGYFVLCK